MLFDDHFRRHRKVSDRSLVILLASGIVCSVALLRPQTAVAALPMQNVLDPRHLDLDPVGNGVIVAPGQSIERTFGDGLSSADDWYMEFLIGNPAFNPAVAFDMKLQWPGDSTQGPGLIQPGHAFVLKVEGPDIPETSAGWKYVFKNPTSYELILDASVSEALSVSTPPQITGPGFFTLTGQPATPGVDNRFTPGAIGGTFVSVGIVPEPTAILLALISACSALLLRRRPTTT